MKNLIFLSLCLSLLSLTGFADDWPAWRGPDANGVAAEGDYPVEFGENTYTWRAELPGRGSSTPIVFDGKVYVSSGIAGDGPAGKDGALCFDIETGKKLWQVDLGTERPGKHKNGSGSCPSAVTDGNAVFFYYKSGTVASLGMDGRINWKTNLQELYGPDTLWWDLGTSPVIAGDNIVIAVMHEGDSYIVALNKENGEEAWKVDRNFDCQKETHQSYTTPIVMEQNGETALVTFGADHLTAHAADDGELLWTCSGFNPEDKAFWRVISSPAVTDGIAVVAYGRAKNLKGVKLGGKGDITDGALIWDRNDVGTDVPTPVAHKGMALVLSDSKNTLHCIDAKTGKDKWVHKFGKARGKFYGSPTLGGDMVYMLRDNGTAYVGKMTNDGIDILAENDMGQRLASSPVLVDGKLLIRGDKHLFCID